MQEVRVFEQIADTFTSEEKAKCAQQSLTGVQERKEKRCETESCTFIDLVKDLEENK